jgi:hypothetical protein
VREIRTLRARRRGLETGSRTTITGHEGGNPGDRQGESYGSPRQSSTLPGKASRSFGTDHDSLQKRSLRETRGDSPWGALDLN